MADELKPKKLTAEEKRRARARFKKLSMQYARQKEIATAASAAMNILAPKIRQLALDIELNLTKEKILLDKDHDIEIRFPTSLVIDQERLRPWMKDKYPEEYRMCFKKVESISFDRDMFTRLEEAGKFPDSDDLMEGEEAIVRSVDGTPQIFVNDLTKAKKK